MHRRLLVFVSVLPLLVTGCKKGESNLTQSTPSPTPVAQATPTTPPDTNRTAKFIVLLYHRFEERPAELVTTPNDFRAQMKALKDNGISVISMQDLLAARRLWKTSLGLRSSRSHSLTAFPMKSCARQPKTLAMRCSLRCTDGTWSVSNVRAQVFGDRPSACEPR
jgi:hypothetical protein